MWRQSTNGYADAATDGNLNGDRSKTEVPTTSSKKNKSESTNGCRTLVILQSEDDPQVRTKYRPFILDEMAKNDWINDLELDAVMDMADRDLQETKQRLKVLVLYGSLRRRSYSRFVAFEASRILFRLGCDVRVYDPNGLPVKDDVQHTHEKVQELRELSRWSDGHVWISPEQHGNLTAVFKNQIDWIPLTTGSVRPTQGRTLAIGQVSGGSQSFNSVNSLRILGRWMRMFTIPNQSSIPMAYTQFSDEGQPDDQRLMPSANRDRLVDCMEEFVKYTILMRPHIELLSDRFSERMERQRREAKITKEMELELRSVPTGEKSPNGKTQVEERKRGRPYKYFDALFSGIDWIWRKIDQACSR